MVFNNKEYEFHFLLRCAWDLEPLDGQDMDDLLERLDFLADTPYKVSLFGELLDAIRSGFDWDTWGFCDAS